MNEVKPLTPPTIRGLYRMFRLCGWLPLSDDGPYYRLFSIVMTVTNIVFVACILATLKNVKTIAEAVEILMSLSSMVLAFVKALIFRQNMSRIKDAHRLIAKLHIGVDESTEERDLVKKAHRDARTVEKLIVVPYYMGCILNATTVLLDGHSLLYPSLFPFDWDATRTTFYATFAFQMLGQVWSSSLLSATDTTAPMLYGYLIAFLDILCLRLKAFGHGRRSADDKRIPKANSEALTELELRECVLYHLKCLE